MNFRWRIVLFILPVSAFAHSGEQLEPHDLWQAWRFDPGVVVPLLITAWLFLRGARADRGVSFSQFASFWSGWSLLALGLISPLHPLGEALFSAHMAQHELLMVGAAPLLVLSRPLVPMLWGLPLSWRRNIGSWSKRSVPQGIWAVVTRPMSAWCIHAVALWMWHIPYLFQATLESEWVHSAQHISFFGSALLFWWSLFFAHGPKSYGASVLYIFTTAVHTSILGALITFADKPWYPAYVNTVAPWGLSALEDQQIGGLIMWIPAGLIYMAAGLWLFARWLRESDLMAEAKEYAR
jgi:cytochrome c oxidase assembly factor CtaG